MLVAIENKAASMTKNQFMILMRFPEGWCEHGLYPQELFAS